MDDKHRKKMIAPVVITAVFVLTMLVLAVILIGVSGLNSTNILFVIPLMALGIGMIKTLKSRIEEIRSGEEDDLSNY
jgi:hypothetical protein